MTRRLAGNRRQLLAYPLIGCFQLRQIGFAALLISGGMGRIGLGETVDDMGHINLPIRQILPRMRIGRAVIVIMAFMWLLAFLG